MVFNRKGNRKSANHKVEFGKTHSKNDVDVLNARNKKLEIKRDIKKNKQDYKIKTSKDRAAVKRSRIRTVSVAYQAKQAHDTTKETVKQDAQTKKELAKIQQQMKESDNQVELERIKARQEILTKQDKNNNNSSESSLINGGMEQTHLSSPEESNSSSKNPSDSRDPDKDGNPGYSWGMI